jgi:hypothetical protein
MFKCNHEYSKAIPHYTNQFGDICYICPMCQQEYEFEHEKPYIINGEMYQMSDKEKDNIDIIHTMDTIHKHKNKNKKDKLRIIQRYVCPYCACNLGNWSEI